ncbi:response regulator transcription factor [Lachnospiraceae bacterium MD308]|nr:response regulator transcription factor [Lachnospiraceae bacterium MD308]MCI8580762.1 response regulator transcription factor [Dorea sp.]
MINISIIDNDSAALRLLQRYVRESTAGREGVSVVGYRRPEMLLEEIEKRKCHILISDIDMPEMSGLEVAKRVKEANPRVFIIFVTAYMQYAIESYRMDAFQYVLKSELEERLPKILCRLTDMIERDRKNYCFIGAESQKKKVLFDDIIWIKKEKNAKYVTYVMEHESCSERTSLENAVERLANPDFMIVERGCAVNLRHVMRLKDNALYLSNQDTVIISKARIVKVKEKLHRLWSEEEW